MTYNNKITKTLTITSDPTTMKNLEKLLSQLHFNSHWGHSGCFGMYMDGDGGATFDIEGFDTEQYREAVKNSQPNKRDVEIA